MTTPQNTRFSCSNGFPCSCWRAGRNLESFVQERGSLVGPSDFPHPEEFSDGIRAAFEYDRDI